MKTVIKAIIITLVVMVTIGIVGVGCCLVLASSVQNNETEKKENIIIEAEDELSKTNDVVVEDVQTDNSDSIDWNDTNNFEGIDWNDTILFDSNGIKIVAKYIDTCSIMKGFDLHIAIENNSKKNITVQTRDASANGYMAETLCSQDVVAGKKAITSIDFYGDAINDISLDDLKTIEFYFHIFNMDDWMDSFDSDVIKMEIE